MRGYQIAEEGREYQIILFLQGQRTEVRRAEGEFMLRGTIESKILCLKALKYS